MEKRPRGRPKVEKPSRRFHTSFKDDATLERLDVLSKRWGVTRPEVIDLLTRFAVNGEPLPDPPASDGDGAGG